MPVFTRLVGSFLFVHNGERESTDFRPVRCTAVRIAVDQNGATKPAVKISCQVDGGRRLGDPALVADDCEERHATSAISEFRHYETTKLQHSDIEESICNFANPA